MIDDFPLLSKFKKFPIKSKSDIQNFDVKQLIEYFFTDVYKNLCNQIFAEIEEFINNANFIENENKGNLEKANKISKLISCIEKSLTIAEERNFRISKENESLTLKLQEKIKLMKSDIENFIMNVNNSNTVQIDKTKLEDSIGDVGKSNEVIEILKKINLSLNDFKKKR